MGLTYKENTHATKNSPALATLEQFPTRRFRAHDPAAELTADVERRLDRVETPLAAAEGAAVLMILTPWPEYRRIAPSAVAAAMSGGVVIDPFAVLDAGAAAAAGLDQYSLGRRPRLGRSPEPADN